jgi:integrase
MNRPESTPSYRLHKPSGLAIVTLPDGKGRRRDVLLGKHGTPASHREYERIISEWEAAGRRVPTRRPLHGLTVAELLRDYLRYAQNHYRPNEQGNCSEVEAFKRAFLITCELFAEDLAADFGPKKLKQVREAMVKLDWCRTYINDQINRLRRVFKWGVEEELLPASSSHALRAVAPIRAGAPGVRESKKVRPVPLAIVEACLPFMTPTVATMVRMQMHTGMRAGEVCIMRTADIEIGGRVWCYTPHRHKTEYHGKTREVFIGPKAQEVLKPWLRTELEGYLFTPAQAQAEQLARRRAARRTPLWPGHIRHQQQKRKQDAKRSIRDHYGVDSYRRAITYACERAFPPAGELAKRKGESSKEWWARLSEAQRRNVAEWRREHHWHPHQLRHLAATLIRKQHGIELTRIVLGHSNAFTTEIYAEADRVQALEVMAKIG